jgi:histone acetyltransferase (RNA polymerase elongator complex component)
MLSFLKTVAPYIDQGLFTGVRVSTRPDAIDEERLKIIREHGVSTVELGAQSMDDHVLTLSKRGHSSEDTVRAVELIKKYGLRVGIQLMPGLPGDSREKFHTTVSRVIDLGPDMVRLYPALVIRGTGLAGLYEEGRYQPLELNQAIEICAENCMRLEDKGIPVIRIGLMSSPSLLEEGQIIAGPWHPAFGFLVRSAIYHLGIRQMLPDYCEAAQIRIMAPKEDIALIRGYKNQGLKAIEEKTGAKVFKLGTDDSIPRGKIRVEKI